MDRFYGKVYSRRNRKSEDVLIANSTSGNVPDGGVVGSSGGAVVVNGGDHAVEMREGSFGGDVVVSGGDGGGGGGGGGGDVEIQEGSCGRAVVVSGGDGGGGGGGGVEIQEGSCGRAVVVRGGDGGGSQPNVKDEVANRFVKPMITRVDDRVRISLKEARSTVEIRNHRRSLEGELDHVRSLVKKIEAKEKLNLTLVDNAKNNRSIVLVPARGSISCRYPRFTFTNDFINRLPLVRPNLPTPFRPPSLPPIANYNPMVSGGFVEREKRIPKVNNYYNNSEYLLGMDRLPSEINRIAKTNKIETRKKPSHVGRTSVPIKPKAKDPNKRDMTLEETQKLTRDLENLPPEKLVAVAEIIKKGGATFKQNNEELELDIDSVDAETLWELDRFMTNYRKSSNSKRKPEAAWNAPITISGPMVAAAVPLKESRTGEMHTRASSTHVQGEKQEDNASSSSSDSGSSSSDSNS